MAFLSADLDIGKATSNGEQWDLWPQLLLVLQADIEGLQRRLPRDR